jgi:hypothetical protein
VPLGLADKSMPAISDFINYSQVRSLRSLIYFNSSQCRGKVGVISVKAGLATASNTAVSVRRRELLKRVTVGWCDGPSWHTRGTTTSSSASHDRLSPSIGSAEGNQLNAHSIFPDNVTIGGRRYPQPQRRPQRRLTRARRVPPVTMTRRSE